MKASIAATVTFTGRSDGKTFVYKESHRKILTCKKKISTLKLEKLKKTTHEISTQSQRAEQYLSRYYL